MDTKLFAVVGVALILAFANAEESCPDNQEYQECGTYCPITCDNKDNPPFVCPLVCVSGCFCKTGYYKTTNGTCVTEDDCNSSQEPPTQVCPNNQVFSTCGSACPLTCANKDNPPTCIEVCVAECTCPSGMVAADDGNCVTPENCPVTIPESCQLPPEPGLCKAYIPSYFYNSTAGNCHIFIYGGCQGNDNRYTSYQECMNTCSDVEIGLPAIDAEYTTKETCPVVGDAIGTCEEACAGDDECSSSQLCCSNGCGHSCAETTSLPYYSPPMSCPAIDPLFDIFCTLDFGCQSHDECGSGELCCPTGCGSICKTAVTPTPLCTEVNAQASSSGLLGAFVPECDSQGNFSLVQCHENMCWCADPATGVPTSSPVVSAQPDCGQNTCEYNGNTYTEGQNFPSSDGCNSCFCAGGAVGCTLKACIPTCEYNGKFYIEGDNFPSTDGCNSCFCTEGIVGCTEKACFPVVKNCEYNGQVYNNGTTFLASDGCNTCHCLDGDAFCTEMGCLCQSAGLEVVAGSPLDIGCAVCDCIWAIQQINCSPKDDDSCVPTEQMKRVSMRFTGDYDSIDDMDTFEESVINSLLHLYGTTKGLKREQITDIKVTSGSIVIELTLQDVDEGANVTLLVIQMHNDYKNKSIVIIYHELILTPTDSDDDSDFSVGDEDQDEEIEFLFITVAVIAALTLVLTACVVILACAVVRMHRKKNRFTRMGSPQSCAVSEDADFEMKADLSKLGKA